MAIHGGGKNVFEPKAKSLEASSDFTVCSDKLLCKIYTISKTFVQQKPSLIFKKLERGGWKLREILPKTVKIKKGKY